MTKTSLPEGIHCYIDGASGQYIPKRFATETIRECITGVKQEDLDYLARGPGGCLDDDKTLSEGETIRGEWYWETWDTILDSAIVTCPISGRKFKLYQDDSLFLVSEDWEWNNDLDSFERPESDTLRRYILPAYWACSLINGDDSGLEPEEPKQIEAFIKLEGLEKWTCADCSSEPHFSYSNDATTLGGDVLRYTFIKI